MRLLLGDSVRLSGTSPGCERTPRRTSLNRWTLRAIGIVLALATALAAAVLGRAPDDPWMADAGAIIQSLNAHPAPRQLVVVFDDSGSMRSRVPETGLSRWQEARAATSEVLTTAMKPGDTLTVLPFDSVVHDPIVKPNLSAGDIPHLGQFIPSAISAETGTNMRLAHDRALEILAQSYKNAPAGKKPWQAIVVVSDGFNDAPPIHTPAWFDYAKFCNVHSDNQNLYPNTNECNQWRTDAKQFESSGQGETYGIGVKVNEGVPEYRPIDEKPPSGPQSSGGNSISGTVFDGDRPAAGARVEALDPSGAEVDAATAGSNGAFTLPGLASGLYTLVATENGESVTMRGVSTGTNGVELHMTHGLLWLWILLIALAITGLVVTTALSRRKRLEKVRIQVQDENGRSRTFWLGGGTRVSFGGKDAPGVFPLEVFDMPVAHLRHNASGYSLQAEKGIEAEVGGRKISGSGAVNEGALIRLVGEGGKQAGFQFHDISNRTRTAAASLAGGGATSSSDAFRELDANLKG